MFAFGELVGEGFLAVFALVELNFFSFLFSESPAGKVLGEAGGAGEGVLGGFLFVILNRVKNLSRMRGLTFVRDPSASLRMTGTGRLEKIL